MAVLNLRTNWVPAIGCCLALATAGGCRNLDNAQVDVLERELRQQEDYIYELEDYLISYSEKLRQCRMAANCGPSSAATTSSGKSKKKTLPGEPQLMEDLPRPASKPAADVRSAPAPPAADLAPTEGGSEPETIDPKDLEVPELEFGPGANSLQWKSRDAVAAAPAPTERPALDDSPLYIPDPVDYQDDGPAGEVLAEQAPATATPPEATEGQTLPAAASPERFAAQRLEIRRVFGEPADEEPAKLDRLLVVVEALSEADEPVDAAGATSLMVMARDEAGELKRVERWDFTPDETAAAWQSSRLGDGLHLELPLGGRELPAGNLELWARLVDADGGKLLASLPLEPTQLTSVANALAEPPTLASEPLPRPIPATDQMTPDEAPTRGRSIDEPQWRASAERLDRDRVEGFASTAGKPSGWQTQSPLSRVQRVAATTATDAEPASAPEANSPRRWTPFR